MVYTLTLNPAVDYLMWTDNLVTGETNRSSMEYITVGGKGINVSLVLRELGVKSVATGFVGGFTGDIITSELHEKGVSADFVKLIKGFSRINVKIKGETETEINGKGPEISENDFSNIIKKLDFVAEGDILVLAGSVPPGLNEQAYENIIKAVAHRQVKVVVDTTGDFLVNTLKYRPFLVKPNIHELEDILGEKLETAEKVFEGADLLRQKGAQNVLVSMGDKGAILVDSEGKRYMEEPLHGKVINSVGAGDSMVAGFIAGYLKTGDFNKALKMGNAAGAATAFSKELATEKEIEKLLEE